MRKKIRCFCQAAQQLLENASLLFLACLGFVFYCFLVVLIFLCLCTKFTLAVHAAEPPVLTKGVYEYSMECMCHNYEGSRSYGQYKAQFVSDYPIFGYIDDQGRKEGGHQYFDVRMKYYWDETNNPGLIDYPGLRTGSPVTEVKSYTKTLYTVDSSGNVTHKTTDITQDKTARFTVMDYIHNDADYKCNFPVFDSEESLEWYIKTGDTSGMVRDGIDHTYDDKHDFGKDTYNADMPVPQLTNLSHNGFRVRNASEDLFIEVVVESKFYGAKHSFTGVGTAPTQNDKYEIIADTSWEYSKHYFNFADRSHIAVNSSTVNIKDLWGVDNEAALVEDFKKWSTEYPKHSSLPDYNFFRHSNGMYNTEYNVYHVFSSPIEASNSVKLKRSGQASTTFYVRFYDKNLKYGKWVYYTFKDFGGTVNGTNVGDRRDDLETGEVGSDSQGNPKKENPQGGKQDPDTGDFEYIPYNGKNNIDASDLWNEIKGLVNSMGEFPDLVASVFSFLPSWVLYMIAAGIAACIILRFVGR